MKILSLSTQTCHLMHCLANNLILLLKLYLNQRRFLDYEDIKIEDIKSLAKTKEPDNKPKWMRDKEILSKQNELRVSSSWSTENEPKKQFKANPKASQKLAEIAAKHNIKGRSR